MTINKQIKNKIDNLSAGDMIGEHKLDMIQDGLYYIGQTIGWLDYDGVFDILYNELKND